MNKNKNISKKDISRINRTQNDKLKSITPILLFLVISLLLYQQFTWRSGNRIGIPIPGMMSIVPAYYMEAEYDDDFNLGDSLLVYIKTCSNLAPACMPCPNCSVDLYYDHGSGRQLYKTDLALKENGTILIGVRSIPIWLFVKSEGIDMGFLRIPKANLFDHIYETYKNYTNKLNFIIIWVWILTALWTLYSLMKYSIKFIYKKFKKKKEKPEYIG